MRRLLAILLLAAAVPVAAAPYLGDYDEDEVVHFIWHTTGADGASITRSGDGTIHVYKDNADGTEVTTDITNDEDFDSLTGIHSCTIDLGNAAFYAAGANYTVILKSATIDGQSVSAVLAHFSIENRFMRGTDSAATASALSTHDGKLDTVDTNVDDIETDTGTTLPATLASMDGKLDTIDTNVDDIETDTGTTLPAEHAALPTAAENRTEMDSNSTDLNTLVTGVADVPTVAEFEARTIVTADYPTHAEVQTECSTPAEVNTQADAAIETYRLDEVVAVAAAAPVADSFYADLLEDDGGQFRFEANALEEAPGGGDGSGFSAIPWNAAWDAEVESEVDDSIGGGTGAALSGIPWNASWDAEVESEVNDGLIVQELDHLIHVADDDAPANGSIVAEFADYGTPADWSNYNNTTMSLRALLGKVDEDYIQRMNAHNSGLMLVDNPCGSCTASVFTDTNLDPDPDAFPGDEDNTWNGYWVTFYSADANYLQWRMVCDYDAGTTAVTLCDPLPTAITANTIYDFYYNIGFPFHSVGIDGNGLDAIPWNASWDAEVESEVEDAVGGDVTSILGDTGTDGVVLSTATKEAIADALLGRNVDSGGNGTNTCGEAFAFLRNRWEIDGGTLTVYEDDDVTPLWTSSLTTDNTADPVIESEP